MCEGSSRFHGTKQATNSTVQTHIFAGHLLNVILTINFFVPASFRTLRGPWKEKQRRLGMMEGGGRMGNL